MNIDVVTIFPDIIEHACGQSIVGRAQKKKIVRIKTHDIREFSPDRRLSVDDTAYGGGPGMILKPEPVYRAVENITGRAGKRAGTGRKKYHIILLSPQGELFSQKKAGALAKKKNIILVCGHYKGIDERVRKNLITEEISIGDYVLTGGEIPALVVIDSIVRLLTGAMSNENSYKTDSFYGSSMLDCPYYTKPSKFRDMEVPAVLLSGNHLNIRNWRREKALRNTYMKRPDLLKKARLSKTDKEVLKNIKKQDA